MDRIIIEEAVLVCTPCAYLGAAMGLSLAIRFVSAVLRAMEKSTYADQFPANVRTSFQGWGGGKADNDHWFPYFIGILELMTFPFLMAAGLWTGVAGWIGLKTLPQWSVWKDNRSTFNRFLIGNALVVILAFKCLTPCVSVKLQTAAPSNPDAPSASHTTSMPKVESREPNSRPAKSNSE